jgi:hypothetical protein
MTRKYLISLLVLTILCLCSSFAGSISGVVTSNGNPVEGATVIAVKVPFDSTIIMASSNIGGNYLLQNIPAGEYQLRCHLREIVVEDSGLVSVQTNSSVVGVNFQLPFMPPVNNSISGRITNRRTNEPIVGATARLMGPGNPVAMAQSDSQGQFTFSNVQVGNYTLSAIANGFDGITYPHDLFIDRNTNFDGLNMALDPAIDYHSAITGYVYDSVSGLPIAGASIFNGLYTIRFDSLHPNLVFTDSNGFFIFSNVMPMAYQLTCSAFGYKVSNSYVVVVASETTSVNFYLQPLSMGILSGKVALIDGTPIPGARVEFTPIQWGSGGLAGSATTDSSGAYSASLLTGDYYVSCVVELGGVHLVAWYDGGQQNGMVPVTVLANQTTSGIDFAFQMPRQIHIAISGIVTVRSGNPLEGALVSAGFDSMMRCFAPGQLGTTQTGADGHYALALTISAREQLRFALSARHKGFQVQYYNDKSVPWLADFFVVNSDTVIPDINFSLDSIALQDNSISGTVTSSVGQPILNGFVFAQGKITNDAHMALTDSSGHYTLGNLFDEQYYVGFAAVGFLSEIYDNARIWEQAKAVQAHNAVTGIDAILDSARSDSGHGSIFGRVHNQHGNPLPGVFMTLMHDQHGVVSSSMTLSDGTYTINNVGAGQYTLVGSKAGYASATEAISIASGSSGSSAVNLDLQYQAPSTAVNVGGGWNLVSLPMKVADGRTISVFPGFTGSFYRYTNQGYTSSEQLSHGNGYWMKNSSIRAFDVAGEAVTAETIEVAQGWNMIGALSLPVPVSSIMSTQQGFVTSRFYGFGNGYVSTDTLYPGKGYWVKINAAGMLVISLQSSRTLHAITIARTTEVPPSSPSGTQTIQLKPAEYAMGQNYPNPFNPATTIKYQLPADSKIVITIYNIIGQVVGNLVDGIETAGYKEVAWNAGNAASGLYFCRIEASSVDDPSKSFTQVKKMILLR